ncbi:hypothetical protein J3Q64DRAFT_1828026 [Phycomyces blakesleeanus]|uniref:C2H2-type domain-containing protein n=1 Tax=Phycomyces blakesleeanus TaxID=4837 RepID=A0ABR3BDK4_PHYBL
MEILELVNKNQNLGEDRHFKCPHSRCTKSFGRRSDLERHSLMHTTQRPFQCHEKGCGKSFIQPSALKVHLRTHSGERPHACEYPGCTKSFSDSSSLARHRRIHTGKRTYKCPFNDCNKGFIRKSILIKHMKASHIIDGKQSRVKWKPFLEERRAMLQRQQHSQQQQTQQAQQAQQDQQDQQDQQHQQYQQYQQYQQHQQHQNQQQQHQNQQQQQHHLCKSVNYAFPSLCSWAPYDACTDLIVSSLSESFGIFSYFEEKPLSSQATNYSHSYADYTDTYSYSPSILLYKRSPDICMPNSMLTLKQPSSIVSDAIDLPSLTSCLEPYVRYTNRFNTDFDYNTSAYRV